MECGSLNVYLMKVWFDAYSYHIWKLLDVIWNPATSFIAAWGLVVIGTTAVLFAIHDAFRNKTALPVIVTLSGILCVIPEVFVGDIGETCSRSANFAYNTSRIMGREVNWFSVATWFAFGTAVSMICYTSIFRNVQTKWLWIGFAVVGAVDIVFEQTVFFSHGLYYEPLPFVILTRFPWWRMTIGTTGLFLSAALAYRYRRHLKGWLSMLMFAITPLSYLAVYSFVGIPTLVVSKESYSSSAGILIYILCITVVALTMQLVLKRGPLEMEGRSPLEKLGH
ncbi:MAG: hypothetical protein ABFD10_22800 [Prolixibacteraceae bacterium]